MGVPYIGIHSTMKTPERKNALSFPDRSRRSYRFWTVQEGTSALFWVGGRIALESQKKANLRLLGEREVYIKRPFTDSIHQNANWLKNKM